MKQLVKTEDFWADDEPLLEYFVSVCNHFWQSYDPQCYTVDAEGNKEWGGLCDSNVPRQFAARFFNGSISTEREQKYLSSEEVLETLKAFSLDYEKFWYLCLGIKDYVEGCTDNAVKSKKTPRKELKAMVDELNKLEPNENPSSGILTLKVGKHPVRIENATTLRVINIAIQELLEKYKEQNNVMDAVKVDFSDKVTLKPIYKIALFNKYLSWFLKDKVANKDIYASKDKSLLVSRMIFILGISDDEFFFEEYKEDGSKLDYLRNYIKKYKDIDVPTCQFRYWM